MNLFPERPTPIKAYLTFPLTAAAAGGAGAFLISLANEFPAQAAVHNGAGWGLVFGATAFLVTINSVGNERMAYWQYKTEQAAAGARDAVPAGYQDPRKLRHAETETLWVAGEKGETVRGDFASLNGAALRQFIERVTGGDYSLAYNKLRLLTDDSGEYLSDKTISVFRLELKDRGFAIEGKRSEMIMTSTGKRHFYRLAREISVKPPPSPMLRMATGAV